MVASSVRINTQKETKKKYTLKVFKRVIRKLMLVERQTVGIQGFKVQKSRIEKGCLVLTRSNLETSLIVVEEGRNIGRRYSAEATKELHPSAAIGRVR